MSSVATVLPYLIAIVVAFVALLALIHTFDTEVLVIAVVVVVIVGVGVVALGPYVAGYHRGYGGFIDAASGEHCIRWVGSVWCKTVAP